MGLKKFFAKLLRFGENPERRYPTLPGETGKTEEEIERAQRLEEEKTREEALESLKRKLEKLPPKVIEPYERKAE